MAFEPNPEILVSGTVVGVSDRRKFGSEEVIGQEVVILAKSGFVTIRVPKEAKVSTPTIDQGILWSVDFNQWSLVDRETKEQKTGTTLTFKHSLTPADLAAIEASIRVKASA